MSAEGGIGYKLFLNSYAILRAVRTLEGVSVDTDTLDLWTILRLRWPAGRRRPRS